MKDNASKIKPDDHQRYVAQQEIVTKIVAIFDDPSYSDENTEMCAKVTTLMNDVRALFQTVCLQLEGKKLTIGIDASTWFPST